VHKESIREVVKTTVLSNLVSEKQLNYSLSHISLVSFDCFSYGFA